MKQIVSIAIILGVALVLGCSNMELVTSHGNPLDTIYDDGDFRIVLSQPVKQSNGGYSIEWSNVFHKTEGELDSKTIINSGMKLLFQDSNPTGADLEKILANTSLSSWSTVKSISSKNDSYGGSFDLGEPTVNVRSYVIEMSYVYKDGGNSKTGIIHSNIVVYEK